MIFHVHVVIDMICNTYLSVFQTVCYLANFVYSLLIGKGSDGEMGVLVPTLFH